MKCLCFGLAVCILYFAVIPIKQKKKKITQKRQVILQPGRINGRAAGRYICLLSDKIYVDLLWEWENLVFFFLAGE